MSKLKIICEISYVCTRNYRTTQTIIITICRIARLDIGKQISENYNQLKFYELVTSGMLVETYLKTHI